MCTIHPSKHGDYVTLCKKHGDKAGMKIPLINLQMNIANRLVLGQINCVPVKALLPEKD